MKQKLSSAAEENGLPAVADVGLNKFLSSDMYTKLGALMNRMSLSWAGKITNVQIFITESYVYDRNGNRVQKITPFGTINYLYDVENRMISSGSNGKTVVNYTYDKKRKPVVKGKLSEN